VSYLGTDFDGVLLLLRPRRSLGAFELSVSRLVGVLVLLRSRRSLGALFLVRLPLLVLRSRLSPGARFLVRLLRYRRSLLSSALQIGVLLFLRSRRSLLSLELRLSRSCRLFLFVRRRWLRSHKVLDVLLGSRPFIGTRGSDSSKRCCDAHLPIRPRRHCRLPQCAASGGF